MWYKQLDDLSWNTIPLPLPEGIQLWYGYIKLVLLFQCHQDCLCCTMTLKTAW